MPTASSRGFSARTNSVRLGMSKPLSRPCRAWTGSEWLRQEPGWICSTRPSSRLMRAISVSIWPRKASASSGETATRQSAREERGGLGLRQVLGARGGVAVVGAGGAERLEEGAALAVGFEVSVPGGGVAAGDLAQARDVGREARELGIDDGVGAVGGHDPAVPARLADRLVPAQVVERAVGGGDDFDVEPAEERPRQVLGPRQAVGDVVVGGVGGLGREADVEAEDRLEGVVEPEPRRGAAQQVVVLGEAAPDRSSVGLGLATVGTGNAEVGERHALRAEHAEDIVVGDDEELRRVGEGQVLGVPARVGMAVRADDRQVAYLGVERARKAPHRGIGWKQAIRIQKGHAVLSLSDSLTDMLVCSLSQRRVHDRSGPLVRLRPGPDADGGGQGVRGALRAGGDAGVAAGHAAVGGRGGEGGGGVAPAGARCLLAAVAARVPDDPAAALDRGQRHLGAGGAAGALRADRARGRDGAGRDRGVRGEGVRRSR